MLATIMTTDFGPALRHVRQRRHLSQLALASEAGVSQRHISFLETGRSRPSREMVVHLGVVLDLPLRDRNALLLAAGFAPVYQERSLDDPDLGPVRRAIDLLLTAHEPFPAYVVDRGWNLVLANGAAGRLLALLPAPARALATNMARLALHPDGMRTVSSGWDRTAASIRRRLERELADRPGDGALATLLDEIRSYPVQPREPSGRLPGDDDLIVPVTLRFGDDRLALLTTVSTLAGPTDITTEELRLETLLPADPATEAALRRLAASSAGVDPVISDRTAG